MLLESFRERVKTVREFMSYNGIDSLLLSKCCNFSWFTFGGRSHITLNATEGEASILITEDSIHLLTNNIELQRLMDLEIDSSLHGQFEIQEYPWYERPVGERKIVESLARGRLFSDTGRYGTQVVDLVSIRSALSEYEIETYSTLGKECDEIFSEKIHTLTPAMTELDVQAIMYGAMAERDIEPVLSLAFSEESSLTYRHNLSRNSKLGMRGFVSICARRKGLVVSSSRSFMFDDFPEIREQHARNCYVDSVAIASSRPGARLSDIFEKIKEAYSSQNAKGEWEKHHQGGSAGYMPREMVANPYASLVLKVGSAVAWNPTIKGTKSEDTAVICSRENSIISFPESSVWPSISFEIGDQKIRRPDILLLQ